MLSCDQSIVNSNVGGHVFEAGFGMIDDSDFQLAIIVSVETST